MSGTAIINADTKAAIHELIAVDGIEPSHVASMFKIDEKECRRLYFEAKEEAIRSHSTRALYAREINELAYMRIIQQANKAWETSKKPKTTKLKKTATSEVKALDGTVMGVETKTTEEHKSEEQNGDPRFLSLQSDAIDKISKLHGAEAPKRVELESKTTLDVYLSIDAMPREEREKKAELAKLIQSGVLIVEEDHK